ncbi:MAG: biopolymer transporter ExbD [Sinimarinibacterium sp.]|jgi:biopolymer transport protein ExbD
MKLRRRDRPALTADMLPILNVVLLLLAFFLMLVRFAPGPARSGELPRSASATTDRSELPLLRLGADGRVADGARPLQDADLGAWLQRTQANGVRLQADGAAPAVRVLTVIGRLRSAGAERVLLMVAGDR